MTDTMQKTMLLVNDEAFPEIKLALMDILLGDGIDGTQAAEIILGDRDIPIVFLSSHCEREVKCKTESTVFSTEHSVVPLMDEQGGKIGWVSVVRNISERMKAEEALRESEMKYRYIFENDPIGIFKRKIEGKYLICTVALAGHFECDSIA